jgi:hypothetical protein
MNVRTILALAKDGRPDLAAKNLGISGAGSWSHPVRLLRIVRKYPHSSGEFFSMRYLALCWKDGRAEAAVSPL